MKYVAVLVVLLAGVLEAKADDTKYVTATFGVNLGQCIEFVMVKTHSGRTKADEQRIMPKCIEYLDKRYREMLKLSYPFADWEAINNVCRERGGCDIWDLEVLALQPELVKVGWPKHEVHYREVHVAPAGTKEI